MIIISFYFCPLFVFYYYYDYCFYYYIIFVVIIIIIIIINIIIIQGKDDTKLNKEIMISAESCTVCPYFWRFLSLARWSNCLFLTVTLCVCPPDLQRHKKITSELKVYYYYYYYYYHKLFSLDQISWSIYFLLPLFGS